MLFIDFDVILRWDIIGIHNIIALNTEGDLKSPSIFSK